MTSALIPVLRLVVDDATVGAFVRRSDGREYRGVNAELRDGPAVLGRSPDVDVRLEDKPRRVSRAHLVFEPRPLGWLVADLGSRHGTRLWEAGLPTEGLVARPGVRHRLSTGVRIQLADTIRLIVVLDQVPLGGTSTANGEPSAPTGGLFPRPDRLPLAYALTEWCRSGSGRSQAPSVIALATALDTNRARIYEWADELASLPVVQAYLELPWWSHRQGQRPEGWRTDLAEALVSAFPEMLGEPALDVERNPGSGPTSGSPDRADTAPGGRRDPSRAQPT